jgi:hypothetical protein
VRSGCEAGAGEESEDAQVITATLFKSLKGTDVRDAITFDPLQVESFIDAGTGGGAYPAERQLIVRMRSGDQFSIVDPKFAHQRAILDAKARETAAFEAAFPVPEDPAPGAADI